MLINLTIQEKSSFVIEYTFVLKKELSEPNKENEYLLQNIPYQYLQFQFDIYN